MLAKANANVTVLISYWKIIFSSDSHEYSCLEKAAESKEKTLKCNLNFLAFSASPLTRR